MQQFSKAQQQLRDMVHHQHQAFLQTSNKVATEYIKHRQSASEKSQVNPSVIEDLEHQIYTLEQLKKSGVITEGISQIDIDQLITQYKTAKDQLMLDVREQMMPNQVQSPSSEVAFEEHSEGKKPRNWKRLIWTGGLRCLQAVNAGVMMIGVGIWLLKSLMN